MSAKKYKELGDNVRGIAGETYGPNRQVVNSLAYLIEAFSELDKKIKKLDSSINNLNKATTRLMWVQIIIAVIALVAASGLTVWSVQ